MDEVLVTAAEHGIEVKALLQIKTRVNATNLALCVLTGILGALVSLVVCSISRLVLAKYCRS